MQYENGESRLRTDEKSHDFLPTKTTPRQNNYSVPDAEDVDDEGGE